MKNKKQEENNFEQTIGRQVKCYSYLPVGIALRKAGCDL
jgi:hypothetical protein